MSRATNGEAISMELLGMDTEDSIADTTGGWVGRRMNNLTQRGGRGGEAVQMPACTHARTELGMNADQENTCARVTTSAPIPITVFGRGRIASLAGVALCPQSPHVPDYFEFHRRRRRVTPTSMESKFATDLLRGSVAIVIPGPVPVSPPSPNPPPPSL